MRFNCSQAIRVEPLPPNKSTIFIISLFLSNFFNICWISFTGFCVGWTLFIFSLDKVLKGRKQSDVSCIVKTEDTSLLEIKDTKAVIQAGYNSVMENKDKILKLLQ